MALIIDSSVVIGLERRGLALDWLATVLGPNEGLGLSAITLSELLLGAHLADNQARRERREDFIHDVLRFARILDFDGLAARTHAQLWGHLRSSGAMIGYHDLIIAATAIANSYDVMTENVREFERIPGLAVRRPGW